MPVVLVVALGGVLGASVRWGIADWADHISPGHVFPWATLIVNVVGSAAIALAARRWVTSGRMWAFVVTGVLGGFTTFSAFTVDVVMLLDDGRSALALTYLASTLLVGYGAHEVARTT